MRKQWPYASPLLAMACVLAAPAAQAREVAEQPFFKAEFYKKNITLEEFRVNPRNFFRSEAAFDLIVDYVGGEIGQPLTGSQFVALVRSDQVRVRDCPGSEKINTGALAVNQFHWFVRACRSGEQILQVMVKDRWIDVMSLNCGNANEDQTPVPPPMLTYVPPPPVFTAPPPPQVTMTYREGFSVAGGTYASGCCGCFQVYTIQGVSIPGSSSTQIIF